MDPDVVHSDHFQPSTKITTQSIKSTDSYGVKSFGKKLDEIVSPKNDD